MKFREYLEEKVSVTFSSKEKKAIEHAAKDQGASLTTYDDLKKHYTDGENLSYDTYDYDLVLFGKGSKGYIVLSGETEKKPKKFKQWNKALERFKLQIKMSD